MSFGFSLGDFITVLDLVKQASKRFEDAPRQYAAISEDLRNFSDVIQDIYDLVSECEPETKDQERLYKIADESTRLRVKRTLKRLHWDQSDIPQSRGRMLLYLELLISLRQQLSSQKICRIEQGVHHLRERCNQQEQGDILDRIGIDHHGLCQSTVFDQHCEGTGQWFLNSEKFRAWLMVGEGLLFCPSLPGAGKTILASIATQHLRDLFGDDNRIGIAYYYCSFRKKGEAVGMAVKMILSSVLRKLALCSSTLPDAIKTLYNKHKDQGTPLSLREIKSALKKVACLFSRIFVVVDGLDECDVWRNIMTELRGLPLASILATCRDYPNITSDLESRGGVRLEVRAVDADVRKYLDGNMRELDHLVKIDRQLQDDISDAVLASSGGMFLLARLHLESFACIMSRRALENAMASLSTGTSTYYDAYDRTMIRIKSQPGDQASIAEDVLAWLTFAQRPLMVEELRTAIIVQETDTHLDEKSLIDVVDLISVCAGLVTVDKKDNSVTLIHYTTREYLNRRLAKWRQGPNAAIAMLCVTYLSFPIFDVEFSKLEGYLEPYKAEVQRHPLLEYCMEYMALHSHLAVIKSPCVDRFLSSDSKITSNWLLLGSKSGDEHAESIAESPIERRVCIDVYDRERRAVLHYAVINGWKRCVQLLLDKGASLEPDIDNMTPLHYTVKARADGEAIAQTFINAGIPIDTPVTRRTYIPRFEDGKAVYTLKDSDLSLAQDPPRKAGLTALHLAALTGSQRMTKFFLDHGANPNFPSDSGETPLHLTLKLSAYGPKWPGIVDFWNEPDNRVESILDYIGLNDDEDEDEFASSHEWIRETRMAIIDLLLDSPDIDVNAQDDFGISPFHFVAQKEYSFESVAEKLINKGAKISLCTKKNKTPLHFAVASRNGDFVSKLLELGADPAERNIDGLNALHYAAKKRHLPIFEEILNHIPTSLSQTILESKDNSGQNLLHHLLGHGFVDVAFVRYLLEKVGGINDLDRAGMNPMAVFLSAFALCEHQSDPEILDLLFGNRADPSFTTAGGLNLGHLVARSHRVSAGVLRTLITRSVSLTSSDERGQTVLHHASIKGSLTKEVLHFLYEEVGLPLDICDKHGKTALDYAIEKGNEDHGPDLFKPDRWKKTERLLRGMEKEV